MSKLWEGSRRRFLAWAGLGAAGAIQPAYATATPPAAPPATAAPPLQKPPAWQRGDTIAILAPAGPVAAPDLADGLKFLASQGLQVRLGRHLFDRDGYLAGRDRDRAADVNWAFRDPAIAGILCARGGWGCGRILPLLDYAQIRQTPKIVLGYSDITALLLALYAQTGLVGFHGPVLTSVWNAFSVQAWHAVLLAGEAVQLRAPDGQPAQTLVGGIARGRLLGGNLSVVASLLGSPYLPAWDGAILFLEEIGEDFYRIDRLLVQLKLAGLLDRLAGIVFGQCRNCGPAQATDPPEPSLSLDRLFADWFVPLGIPVLVGAAIGHVPDKWTLPVGLPVELDATQGTIRLLEPAVTPRLSRPPE